jgi:two-component system response regulator HydG
MGAALSDASRGRVLLVDDERAILCSAEALLDDEFLVRTAPGVREALAIIDAEPIDVIVTDFHLRDGTGEQVLQRARAGERPVFTILVTGWREDPRVAALDRSNRVLVLEKPVAPDLLIEWVRRGLAGRAEAGPPSRGTTSPCSAASCSSPPGSR